MYDIDHVLHFVTELGRRMLLSGANIERVEVTIQRLCHAYGLHNVNNQTMTTSIFVGATDKDGHYRDRRVAVPACGLDMEKLRKLNRLGYKVTEELPNPADLMNILNEEDNAKPYPLYVTLIAQIIAMLALGRLFGGAWQDLIVIAVASTGLFFLMKLQAKIHIAKIIANFIAMFLAGLLALGSYLIGFSQHVFVILITLAFFLVPGIQMVNAARNLLCGNEMNGIIEMLKVALEVLTIAAGLAAAFYLLGDPSMGDIKEVGLVATSFLGNVEIVFISLLASAAFGATFNIKPKELIFAGLGGAIIRIVYLSLMALTAYRIVYITVAAFSAALFAEILAIRYKTPSTIFLYPAIIPLIPGDLFAFTMFGFVWNNPSLQASGGELALSLIGISVGFVVCSSLSHYLRKGKLKKLIQMRAN